MDERLAQRLAALETRHPRVVDLSLDRIRDVLARLGHPEERLPPVIHVAGTNGKGSVIAFLGAMLEAAGRRVHVYTSPHLVDFRERIRLAGRLVEAEPLIAALDAVEAADAGRRLTFFEATTAAAFLLFAAEPADALLLEVGLGGRLDATNVVARPAMAVITPVSLDHQAFLGPDLAAIAGEKAGILKPGAPAVIGPQEAEAAEVIAARAAELGIRLVIAGRDFAFGRLPAAGGQARGSGPARWWYRGTGRRLVLPQPARLAGGHQLANAATAIAVLENLPGLDVPAQAIEAGLKWARWPARLQPLDDTPLAALLPAGSRLWLDGGHNEGAARALAAHFRARGERLHLVVGMLANRDPAAFLAPFRGVAEAVYGVPVAGHAAHAPAAIAKAASGLQMAGLMAADVPGALAQIAARAAGRPVRVLVAGSLYLAGAVLAQVGWRPQ
ncbi:MAG: bifunctional folylpolyglutamate synthase/dihydrofolate synthase [Rhodothalassiaceae bacterium]|nr:MAG: bifunctional folylpolyglutamate synthase/dihydrofolate synthase [Rhodothalassiaceae bacterium]